MNLSTESYVKLMLHACKYPSEPIYGLLLGTATKGSSISVTNVAPLFHTDLVASTLEASLMVVQECCDSSEGHAWSGLSIVGCYVANRLAASNSVSPVAARFGHAIRKSTGSLTGTILVVDNSELSVEKKDALRWFASDKNGGWSLSGSKMEVEESAKGALSSRLQEKKTVVVYDFDDHLDDAEINFDENVM